MVYGTAPQYMSRSTSNPNGIRVKHREYLGEVTTSATASLYLNAYSFSINPGLAASFPWLSNVAIMYESYRFHGLQYHYSGEAATSTTGSVVLALDYDANDTAPPGKQQAMSYKSSVRSTLWEDSTLVAQTADLNKIGPTRYVRSGTVPSTDIKTYDAGTLFVGLNSASASALAGEMYVEYDVEFFTPQLNPSSRASLGSASFACAGSIAAATPFGTTAPTVTGGVSVGPNSTGSGLGFGTVGEFLVVVESVGTVFTDTLPALTAVALSGSTVSAISTALNHNGAATLATYVFRVTVTRPEVIVSGIALANTFTLSFAGDSTTYTATTVRITQYAAANA